MGGDLAVLPLAALGPQELEGGGGRGQRKRQKWKRDWEKGRIQVPRAPTFTPTQVHCQSAVGCQGGFAPIPQPQRPMPPSRPGSWEQGKETLWGESTSVCHGGLHGPCRPGHE